MAQAAEKDPQVGKSSLVSIGKREALQAQVGKSACIVLAKERHSKGERVPFSACFQLVSKLKSEAASTLSLMFQIFLE